MPPATVDKMWLEFLPEPSVMGVDMVTLPSTVPSQGFSTNDSRQHWLQSLGPSVHSMEVLPLITPHKELSVLSCPGLPLWE